MRSGRYHERLTVSVGWWLLGVLFAAAVSWAFFVATPIPVAVLASVVALLAVGGALARYGSALIATDERGLRVGRASLPWSSIGEASALDPAATRAALGVDADARAFLLIRGYCRESVRVVLHDDIDPTPYWLISTRHPRELAAHLNDHRVQD